MQESEDLMKLDLTERAEWHRIRAARAQARITNAPFYKPAMVPYCQLSLQYHTEQVEHYQRLADAKAERERQAVVIGRKARSTDNRPSLAKAMLCRPK